MVYDIKNYASKHAEPFKTYIILYEQAFVGRNATTWKI